ncbi:helix-turn-helix transcriptional regulator [Falsibacillus albus]|uniref:YafY family transcriptional regulator n=1 Tax=Falsibacillus albus TaxID=2478915 RepID=A0A3L7K1C4_9BACI|nr:YafY family protein [Falsibacillus albus]RLQ96883.1 YafY family transcriptional regulator [Falsibacillus albus]
MSKSDNMLSILWLLKTRKRMTAKELSEELEIHIRTIYRYIDALSASGVPIIAEAGHNGGYSLLDHSIEAPLFFNLEEQKALIHAASFAKEAGYPFGKELEAAVSKLKLYTNESQRTRIDRHINGFEVISTSHSHQLENFLKELEQAMVRNHTLTMVYQKGEKDTRTSRNIDPYGLVHWKNKWYVVAYCHYRNQPRSFRVDRIKELTNTDAVFETPVDFSPREFFMKWMLPDPCEQEEKVLIHLHGREQAIADLCQHWFIGRVVKDCTDKDLYLEVSEKEAISYLPYIFISYGQSIEVRKPSFLKNKMISVIQDLLNHHQNGDH